MSDADDLRAAFKPLHDYLAEVDREHERKRHAWTRPVLAPPRQVWDYKPLVFWLLYVAIVIAFVAWMLR